VSNHDSYSDCASNGVRKPQTAAGARSPVQTTYTGGGLSRFTRLLGHAQRLDAGYVILDRLGRVPQVDGALGI
jgi:hypothetical protein